MMAIDCLWWCSVLYKGIFVYTPQRIEVQQTPCEILIEPDHGSFIFLVHTPFVHTLSSSTLGPRWCLLYDAVASSNYSSNYVCQHSNVDLTRNHCCGDPVFAFPRAGWEKQGLVRSALCLPRRNLWGGSQRPKPHTTTGARVRDERVLGFAKKGRAEKGWDLLYETQSQGYFGIVSGRTYVLTVQGLERTKKDSRT